MNFKLTVTLTVLLLVALLLFIMLRGGESIATTAPSSASELLSPKPSDVVQITFSQYGVAKGSFTKENEQWKVMVGESNVDADNAQVDTIARSLGSMTFVQKFAEEKGSKSAEYTGTAKPNYTISFSDKDKHSYTLQIGKSNMQGGAFVTVGTDKTIYVLDSNPVVQLDKDPVKFRNMQVVQIDPVKVTGIALKTRDATWEVSKSPDNKWIVNKPVAARANDGVVQAMLRELQNLRAESYASFVTKQDKIGLDPPITTLTVTSQDSATPSPATTSAPATAAVAPTKTSVLEIGIRTELLGEKLVSPVYASVAGSNAVFILKGETAKNLIKELRDMRDSAVTPVAVNTATDFTLTIDGKVAVAAAQKDKVWNLTAPIELKADPLGISDFLDDVKGQHAIKFVDAGDLASIGLNPPHMKIELTLPGQSQKEVILLGKSETDPEKGMVTPAMRQGESSVFLLQATETEKLETGMLTLRDKEVERLDAGRIRSIEISGPQATVGTVPTTTGPATMPATAPAGAPGITLKREGTRWNAEKGGVTTPSNEVKVSALLGSFTPVFAGKYTDEKPIEGTPVVTVTLTVLESTAPPATLPTVAAAGPSTTPATAPATTSAPATAVATAPATQPNLSEILPASIGPDVGKLVTRTLKLYKIDAPTSAPATAPATTTAPAGPTWKAVWDHQTPTWTFEPTNLLVDQLTKETYATLPATQPSTAPATTKP